MLETFGAQFISQEQINRIEIITGKEAHPYLKRGIFRLHRDLDDFLDVYERGEHVYIYTGRGPSAISIHVGHYIQFEFVRYLQSAFDCFVVIQMADDEKISSRNLSESCVEDLKMSNIRVGRLRAKGEPMFDGHKEIVCTTKSSVWGALGPYVAKRPNGEIMENAWQFRKVYKYVPARREAYSRFHQNLIVWDREAEIHMNDDGSMTDEYWSWRRDGLSNPYHVRYPVGLKHRHNCLHVLTDDGVTLDYVQSRKQIYFKYFVESIQTDLNTDSRGRTSLKRLNDLKRLYEKGEKFVIREPDGPHQESLQYYIDKYDVDESFIQGGTMECTAQNLCTMVNDTKHPFGHGYCLAAYLQGIDVLSL